MKIGIFYRELKTNSDKFRPGGIGTSAIGLAHVLNKYHDVALISPMEIPAEILGTYKYIKVHPNNYWAEVVKYYNEYDLVIISTWEYRLVRPTSVPTLLIYHDVVPINSILKPLYEVQKKSRDARIVVVHPKALSFIKDALLLPNCTYPIYIYSQKYWDSMTYYWDNTIKSPYRNFFATMAIGGKSLHVIYPDGKLWNRKENPYLGDWVTISGAMGMIEFVREISRSKVYVNFSIESMSYARVYALLNQVPVIFSQQYWGAPGDLGLDLNKYPDDLSLYNRLDELRYDIQRLLDQDWSRIFEDARVRYLRLPERIWSRFLLGKDYSPEEFWTKEFLKEVINGTV